MPASLPAFTFGTELECYLPNGVSHIEAARRITAAGVSCSAQNYNHNTATSWKIVTDGSLGDYQRGAEIVSPILRGEAGLAQLHTVCTVLTDMGAEIKRTCGFHVHVGIRNEDAQTVANIYALYGHYEPVIDTFMPRSRRAQGSGYCKAVRNLAQRASVAQDVNEIARIMGRDRYFTVNIESYFRYGTIEFRQHSGTVDPQKATSWVRVLLGLVQAAKDLRPSAPAVPTGTAWSNPYPVGSVNYRLIEALIGPRGITSGEAVAITGRTSGFNLTAIARVAGITVRLRRSGSWQHNRYTVVAGGPSASAATSAPVARVSLPSASLEALLGTIDANPALRSYISERVDSLSA